MILNREPVTKILEKLKGQKNRVRQPNSQKLPTSTPGARGIKGTGEVTRAQGPGYPAGARTLEGGIPPRRNGVSGC